MKILCFLLLGLLGSVTPAPCPQAIAYFEDCLDNGYKAKKLMNCGFNDKAEVDETDLKFHKDCRRAEGTLYRECGHRQCSGKHLLPDPEIPVPGNNMAVATDNDLCTNLGTDVLKSGGSAVDAAIASLLCLAAAQPQSNGLGGGGFMLVHTKEEDKVINFRERAPKNSTQDMYKEDSDLAKRGGLAVGTPGEIAGYFAAHKRFGRLNWPDLFTPSIELLRVGIPVTAHMENALRIASPTLIKCKNARRIYFKDPEDANTYLRAGAFFTNEQLASAYEKIATRGPDAFYTGQIGRNIIKTVKNNDGIMTMEDLQDYKPTIDTPLSFSYREKKVITAPAPASGHVVSLVLQLLNNFNLDTPKTDRDPLSWNRILEAFRFGYAMRSQTGDAQFSEKTRWVTEQIQNGTWAQNVLENNMEAGADGVIRPHSNVQDYMDSLPVYENYDGTHTTHVSILGPHGEAVSVTSTVNLYFGARIMTDDGIILNNQMDDFGTPGTVNSFGYEAAPENYIVPGKRPMSSSSPTIVFNAEGEAQFVTGAAGGSRIITGAILSIIRAMDWEMDLKKNVNSRRLHDQLNLETLYEEGTDKNLVDALQRMGYQMRERRGAMCIVTSVSNLREHTEAEGDPRKEGTGRVVETADWDPTLWDGTWN